MITTETYGCDRHGEDAYQGCALCDLEALASRLAAEGASDRVLQAAGGWSSPRMVARYAHLRADELRPWVAAVGTNAVTALAIIEAAPVEKSSETMVPEEGLEPPTRALRKR